MGNWVPTWVASLTTLMHTHWADISTVHEMTEASAKHTCGGSVVLSPNSIIHNSCDPKVFR